jgi:hypothetical protein
MQAVIHLEPEKNYASVQVLRTRASTAAQLNDGMGQPALTIAGVSRTKDRT